MIWIRFRRGAGEIAAGNGSFRRTAAPLGEPCDLQHPHPPVERHGHHVADPQRMARRPAALAIEADMTGLNQRRGIGPRSHNARMPQPLVDALPVQRSPLLVLVAFERLLERGQFGERRVGIRRLVARA